MSDYYELFHHNISDQTFQAHIREKDYPPSEKELDFTTESYFSSKKLDV